jgi:hypothetical protein
VAVVAIHKAMYPLDTLLNTRPRKVPSYSAVKCISVPQLLRLPPS